jgi:hypothetical protein
MNEGLNDHLITKYLQFMLIFILMFIVQLSLIMTE